jgi:hypothetical protein
MDQKDNQMSTLQELRIKNRERSRVWNHGGLHHMTHEEKDDLIELLFRALELGGEIGELQNGVKKLSRALMGTPGNTEDTQGRSDQHPRGTG